MAQNPNQFSQLPVVGDTSLPRSGLIVSAQVNDGEAVALVPGQAVKVANTLGGVPKVTALAANSDYPQGVVLYNLKNASFPALAPLELGMYGTIVYMTAGGAIARFGQVENVYTTLKVIASVGVNPVLGIAYDKAVADGDVIRVLLQVPGMPITLDQISNVVLTTPLNGQALKYNSGTQHWENENDVTA